MVLPGQGRESLDRFRASPGYLWSEAGETRSNAHRSSAGPQGTVMMPDGPEREMRHMLLGWRVACMVGCGG